MNERVSVVVTTYYRNDWLREAIESVFDLEHEEIELIVVDDSGEAHAEPIVDRYADVTYIPQTVSTGPQAARNIGATVATGSYVHFLDDDDRLRSGKIRKQLEVFRRNPDVGVVYSGLEYEDGSIDLPDPEVRGDVLDVALEWRAAPCYTSSMLIRAEVLDEILPLTDITGVGDLAMIIDLAERTHFEFVDEPLVLNGESDDPLSSSMTNVEGHRELLEHYDRLYEDERMKDRLRARIAVMTGQQLLRERGWSAAAIKSFSWAVYLHPTPLRFGELVLSLAGRPGWKTGFRIYQYVTSN
jgi:glycosyltransferase involved in cell wall biosynthesis